MIALKFDNQPIVTQSTTMKLQFRGKTYERPDLLFEVNEGEIGGMYRGKPWKTHHLREKHRRSHVGEDLTYRGVRYIKE